MRTSSLPYFAFAATAALASPLTSTSHTLVKRSGGLVLPTPGPKSGCDSKDLAAIKSLLDLIKPIVKAGASLKTTDPEYNVYFSTEEHPSVSLHKKVTDRFQSIDKMINGGGSGFPEIPITCGKATDEACMGTNAALAVVDDSQEMVICPPLFDLMRADPRNSAQMDSSSGLVTFMSQNVCKKGWPENFGVWIEYFAPAILLHEMTHIEVSPSLGRTVDCVYGPYWGSMLAHADENVAAVNADNYVAAAVGKYLRKTCKAKGGWKVDVFKQGSYNRDQRPGDKQPLAGKDYDKRCQLPEMYMEHLRGPSQSKSKGKGSGSGSSLSSSSSSSSSSGSMASHGDMSGVSESSRSSKSSSSGSSKEPSSPKSPTGHSSADGSKQKAKAHASDKAKSDVEGSKSDPSGHGLKKSESAMDLDDSTNS